jgi:hypothetical protein
MNQGNDTIIEKIKRNNRDVQTCGSIIMPSYHCLQLSDGHISDDCIQVAYFQTGNCFSINFISVPEKGGTSYSDCANAQHAAIYSCQQTICLQL